jgi:hypothetical protein
MRICFIADARSPIAKNWITYFVQRCHEVHVISSYPCSRENYPNASVREVTSILDRMAGFRHDGQVRNRNTPGRFSRIKAEVRAGRLSRPVPPWLEPPNVLPELLATTR